MTSISKRFTIIAAAALVAVLAVGAATASAHGRPGAKSVGGVSLSRLVTEAAKQLNVSRSTLKTAITDAAIARIDEAVADEDIDADDAEALKEEAGDNLSYAYSLSRASKVASNLGVSTETLNTEFRDARKALAVARIDAAQADGDIDAEEAAELKEELEDADLPGYKSTRGLGIGLGHGGFRSGGPGLGGPGLGGFGPHHGVRMR
jgi:hypothetical protein